MRINVHEFTGVINGSENIVVWLDIKDSHNSMYVCVYVYIQRERVPEHKNNINVNVKITRNNMKQSPLLLSWVYIFNSWNAMAFPYPSSDFYISHCMCGDDSQSK